MAVSREVPAHRKRQVLRRAGYVCEIQLPGCTVEATEPDHIEPYATFDPDDPEVHSLDNLRASCRHCNAALGAHLANERKALPYPSDQW